VTSSSSWRSLQGCAVFSRRLMRLRFVATWYHHLAPVALIVPQRFRAPALRPRPSLSSWLVRRGWRASFTGAVTASNWIILSEWQATGVISEYALLQYFWREAQNMQRASRQAQLYN